MIASQVLGLLTEADVSPEELGEAIGVSGMTIRRWLKKPKYRIPPVYIPAIRDACYSLISKGQLRSDAPVVRNLLLQAPSGQYRAALRNLGLGEDFDVRAEMSEDDMLTGLSLIGAQARKQADVEGNRTKLFSFKSLGDEWSQRITMLWQIVMSRKLKRLDKVVAFGALFYLLTPIDFIPDHIPFVGLLDDFGVLGIAVAYYKRRLSDLA